MIRTACISHSVATFDCETAEEAHLMIGLHSSVFHGGGGGARLGFKTWGGGGEGRLLDVINIRLDKCSGWVGSSAPTVGFPSKCTPTACMDVSLLLHSRVKCIKGSSSLYNWWRSMDRKCFVSCSMILLWSAPITTTLVIATQQWTSTISCCSVLQWCHGVEVFGEIRLCGKVSATMWKVNWGHTWKCSVIVGNKLLMKGKIFYIWAYGFLFG